MKWYLMERAEGGKPIDYSKEPLFGADTFDEVFKFHDQNERAKGNGPSSSSDRSHRVLTTQIIPDTVYLAHMAALAKNTG